MEVRRKQPMDLEHGDLLDVVAKAVMLVSREEDKLEEHLTVLESASGIASPETKHRRG
jgi:hypothetical protein